VDFGGGGGTLDGDREWGDWEWVEWTDPVTGRTMEIIEGYATIGLAYWPDWESPPNSDEWDQQFINHPIIADMLENGYDLLMPYGPFKAGEFKLPPGMTFAAAYMELPQLYQVIDPGIGFVHPWYGVELLTTIPNDPWFDDGGGPHGNDQWYFEDGRDLGNIYMWDVDATWGWDYETGDDDIIIAVMDSGVRRDLHDLTRLTEYGWDCWGEFDRLMMGEVVVPEGGEPQYNATHGAKVASLIAASTDNALDMAGGTWGGTILPIACEMRTGQEEIYDFWVNAALYLLLDQVGIIHLPWMDYEPHYDVRVLNMSFGDDTYNPFWACLLYHLNQEVLLVAGAGNSGHVISPVPNPVIYPAGTELGLAHHHPFPVPMAPEDLVLSVTAIDRDGYRPFWASYYDPDNPAHENFDWVDVCAPGSLILVLYPYDPTGGTLANGTSMSAPLVAALGALRMSRYPDETPDEVRTAIETYIKWWFPPRSEELPDLVDYYNVLIREP